MDEIRVELWKRAYGYEYRIQRGAWGICILISSSREDILAKAQAAAANLQLPLYVDGILQPYKEPGK